MVMDVNLNISSEGLMIVPVEIDENGEITELGVRYFRETERQKDWCQPQATLAAYSSTIVGP